MPNFIPDHLLNTYFYVPNIEMAIVCAAFWQQNKWKICVNATVERQLTWNRHDPNAAMLMQIEFGGRLVTYENCVKMDSKYPVVESLQELKHFLQLGPIIVGDYEVKNICEKGIQVGCTFVEWETIEKILARRPKSNIHNPLGLESPGNGYRFLDKDEVLDHCCIMLYEIEMKRGNYWEPLQSGCDKDLTYRTKLTRDELKKLRNS